MIQPVNIHEAKTNFSKLLKRVQMGDEITIAKAGKPIARLVPFREKRVTRKPGTAKGLIIDCCINNRIKYPVVLDCTHETGGECGGAGATAAASGGVVGGWPFAVGGGTDGGCSGERGLAVAGDFSASRSAGVDRQAYSRATAQTDSPTA